MSYAAGLGRDTKVPINMHSDPGISVFNYMVSWHDYTSRCPTLNPIILLSISHLGNGFQTSQLHGVLDV